MSSENYYLMHVWGAIEPEVLNPREPFESFEALLRVALEFVQEEGGDYHEEESVICYIVVTDEHGVTAGSFTHGQLHPEECEPERTDD